MKLILAALFVILAIIPDAAVANPPQGFAVHATPQDVPEIRFTDGDGRALTLADFRGRTILVNIWATWCPPCIREMPTLDNLQAELGGPGFEVVALSIDRAGTTVVKRFFKKIGLSNLSLYIDETSRAAAALRAFGLPATVLIDPEGRELGRLIGPAQWDTPEMVAFLRSFIPDRAK